MTDVKRLLDEATPLPWRASETTIWSEHNPSDPTDWSGDAVAYTAQDHELEDGTYATAALIVYSVNRLPDYEAAVDALERLVNVLGPASILWTDPVPADSQFALTDARAALRRLREPVPA